MTKFKLATSEIKGRNKLLFYQLLTQYENGETLYLIPFVYKMRIKGASISEASVERYLRFLKEWDWGIQVESLGKCKYLITKLDKKM